MKPLIIRPFGMSAEAAKCIVKTWETEESRTAEENLEDAESNYIEGWLASNPKNADLLSKMRVYTTPGSIASWRRGFHDSATRDRPLAFIDSFGQLVNTVPDGYTTSKQPLGWEPRTYIEGWRAAVDLGKYDDEEEDSWNISHYRIITSDGGNGCCYVREMTFDRRKDEWFDWSKVGEYLGGMAPNSIDSVIIEKLRGRTMNDEVMEVPYPRWNDTDQQVGAILNSQ